MKKRIRAFLLWLILMLYQVPIQVLADTGDSIDLDPYITSVTIQRRSNSKQPWTDVKDYVAEGRFPYSGSKTGTIASGESVQIKYK